MCITEEKLVEAYGNSNPHERFLLIYKNYSIFPQLVDCYETGLFNRILFEVEAYQTILNIVSKTRKKLEGKTIAFFRETIQEG